ncbi:PPOX class F420-dependent oxidoreductase [Streptomyces sp. SID1121]|uniref:PPOX class F420-dependent oxidoreductase n=1 Tax=Streptomyces sp. SID1121 TaxID=3425888 RepID=UPI0040579F16
MASHMSKDQWHAFVSEGTRTAKLATVRADGSPHIAPVWFLLDGDDVIFNTGKETVKGRNLRRDNRVALCVDDERPPFSFVLVEGRAELSEDPEEVLEWAVRLGARYMGEEQAQAVGERNSGPGEVLVRVRVDKVVNVADIAG